MTERGASLSGSEKRVLVLGAGLAGMSCAWKVAALGVPPLVLEKAGEVGGLAKSFTRNGFTMDCGPHRFFTKEQWLLDHIHELLGADNVLTRPRKSRIFLMGRFFDYPLVLSNVVRSLPITTLVKSFADYLVIKVRNLFARKPDDNFENWVINRFGRELYKVFFGTYTEKTWGIPCTQISADWASQRITLLSLWDTVKKTVFRPRNEPRTLVSKFYYPRTGGVGSFCRRYREEVEKLGGKVLTGVKITSIRHHEGRVTHVVYENGNEVVEEPVETLFSTIPLGTLIQILDPPAPPAVLEATRKLRHRCMIFVYVEVARPQITDDNWIYLPEQTLTVHRLSEFKNFSPENAPADRTMLCAEITCDFDDEHWRMADQDLIRITKEDLARIGLVRPEEVRDAFCFRARYVYPLYDLTYKQHLTKMIHFVDGFENLYTAGRQGLFKYGNMDHSIEMGFKVAENMKARHDSHKAVATEKEWFG